MRLANRLILTIYLATCYLLLATNSYAHVGYVLTKPEFTSSAGTDFTYLFSPLGQPSNLALFIVTPILTLLLYLFLPKIPFVSKKLTYITTRTLSYHDLIPWMLRLTLGIALLGAGTSQSLISPLLPSTSPFLSSLEILTGFLLMAGFLTPIAALIAIPLFLYGYFQNSYLTGNLDFLAAALALLILADAKPGVDDLFGIDFPGLFAKFKAYLPLTLRLGIGTAMIYLAVYEKLLNPHASALVADKFGLVNVIPVSAAMWTLSAALIEALIGFLLLIGFRTRLSSAIATLVIALSFFYFKEDVTSHVTLFGVLSVLFVTGSGRVSLDQVLFGAKAITYPRQTQSHI